MGKAHTISRINIENGVLSFFRDNQLICLQISEISQRLAKAKPEQLADYKLSPSGYRIHWRQLDEDLSIDGLVALSTKNK